VTVSSRPARRTDVRLPDFIIGGAMKSGTTTLHYALAQHRSIFIPRQEIFFFSIDDIEQHPNFFIPSKDGWTFFDYDASASATWIGTPSSSATPKLPRSSVRIPRRISPRRTPRAASPRCFPT
jgi:hypothetical protein